MTIIGFVLLVSSCGLDACEALPVSDNIYPTQTECQNVSALIKERRPAVVLICGEALR